MNGLALARVLPGDAVPVSEPVASAGEILGLDPLHVASEGRLVAFISAATADRALAALRAHPAAAGAARIGEVTAAHPGVVHLEVPLGSTRLLDLLTGEQMPRIC